MNKETKQQNNTANDLCILLYADVKSEMLVQDTEGNIGKITNTEHDLHNVEVDYLQGGCGLYCLDESCDEYDPLYICV